jgi:hypothetical protein
MWRALPSFLSKAQRTQRHAQNRRLALTGPHACGRMLSSLRCMSVAEGRPHAHLQVHKGAYHDITCMF